VDNASTEGDIEEITSKYSQVILLRNKKNIGFGAANNVGLKHAAGKYILLLNNDTEILDESLERIINYYEEQKERIFIGCKLLNTDGSRQESVYSFENILNSFSENFFLYKIFPKSKLLNRFYLNHFNITIPIEVDVIKGAFIFCSKDDIEKLNGFDPKFFFYAEETDLCYRFKQDGGKIIYFPQAEIIHHGGASTESQPWFKYKNQSIAKIQFFQKHYSGAKFLVLVSFSSVWDSS
jgi:GT2 family glycosyltransferase